MAKKKYKIKGTKDFLILAVFCGFMCVWAIRDAWFPTRKVLEKHPQEVPAAFAVPGVVREVRVQPGDVIEDRTVIAVLNDTVYQERVNEARARFDSAREARDPETETRLDELNEARAALEKCTLRNTDIKVNTSHGEDVLRGRVLRIDAPPGTPVEAGQPVVTIRPQNSFYIFNQSLAVIMFIGMIISLFFHWVASR